MTRPIVVAHRALAGGADDGGSGPSVRANTVAAIEAAAAAGADAVEIDVRLTRDGHPVLGHDPVQWRAGGRWRRPYLVAQSRRGTLGFLSGLDEAMDSALGLALDVKLDVKAAAGLAVVAAWCRQRPLDLTRIALWSRSPARIAALAGRDAFAEVALLSNVGDVPDYLAAAGSCGAGAVSLHPRALSAAAVSAAHERGLVVYAWILDPDQHRVAVDHRVDGLVTDWVGPAIATRG